MKYLAMQLGQTDGIPNGFRDPVSDITPIQGSVSESDHDQESVISDSESCSGSGPSSGQFQEFIKQEEDGLVRIFEGDRSFGLIKRRFLYSLGLLGKHTQVAAIHRNTFSGVVGQARMQSFQIFAKAVENKCGGGDANVKYAWFGGSSNDVCQILRYGFGRESLNNNGLYGCGAYLSPDDSPLECVKNLSVGEDGLRHLLLCRVILGKAEVVHPGSEQSHPSPKEFDTGVDNLSSPKKYIVWSTHLNTHVLPEFVISFRAPPSLKGFFKVRESSRKPTSPWMPFPALISSLSKLLAPNTVALIAKHYADHRDRKISRQELIHRIRQITGDKLLIAVIKSFATKHGKATSGFQRTMFQKGVKDLMNHGETRGSMDELIMHG